MSGPKSVRYVSIEELLEHCRFLMEGWEADAASWLRRLERAGLKQEGDDGKVAQIRTTLERLIVDEDHVNFQKSIPIEREWFEREFDRRIEEAQAREEQELRQRRRRIGSASTILKTLADRNVDLPPEERQILRNAASGNDVDPSAVNKAIAVAIDALSNLTDDGLSDAQQELVQSLGIGIERQLLEDWMETQTAADEADASKLDKQLAELGLRYGADAIEDFVARADQVAQEPDASRRTLVYDSLTIQVARFARCRKGEEYNRLQAERVLAELGSKGDAFENEMSAIGTALDKGAWEELAQAIETARQAMADKVQSEGFAARRRALLRTLNDLGYSVEEEMEAAFARDGRVVIEKSSRPGYGVELSGLKANDKFQVRAMRFSDTATDQRADLDHETEWCSAFTDLRTVLADMGDDLVIEHAMGVGEQPLKTVERRRVDDRTKHLHRTLD